MDGDADGISELYSRCFGRDSRDKHWQWLYHGQDYPSLIVVAQHNDRIVGHVSGMIKPVDYLGRAATALHSFYAMVDNRYRRTGMFMNMMQMLEENARAAGADIIYGFSYQKQVFPALQRLGRQEIGDLPIYIMPLHPIRLGTLKIPAVRYMDLLDNAFTMLMNNNASPLPTMPSVSFDKAYEDLWITSSRQDTISAHRDKKFLTWRYSARPGGGYRTMVVEGAGGLQAYAVLRTEKKWGLTMVFVMELVVPDTDNEAFDRLISGITSFALTMAADAVSLVATSACPWRDSLMSKGFLKAPGMLLPRNIKLTMKPLMPGVQLRELLDMGRWRISWGDTFYL